MDKLEIEIVAEHIDWKELIERVNEAIKEDTTDVSSVEIEFSVCEEEEET